MPVWIGRRGDEEPNPCAGMTAAERIAMVWPLTLAAGDSAGHHPMNRDFAVMLNALSAESVEVLVVGTYAMAADGLPWATGDIDLWNAHATRP